MQMQAAVFRKVQEPLTIEAVDVDKPLGREVLVRTVATGVCHSDLHVVDGIGRFPLDRPIVLGHEGAGIVEAVGPDVTTVRPGDHVVACLSGFCGSCPQCLSGHPNLCTGGIVTRLETAPPRLSQNGAPFRQFIGISSYAEKMLLHENSIVRIDPEIPLDRAALELQRQQALAAHRLGLDYVLQRVVRFPWSQPPSQRFAEKMMEQAIGVARLGPSSDHPTRRIELERGANHRARIFLGYVPHLHLPERCLDPPLP